MRDIGVDQRFTHKGEGGWVEGAVLDGDLCGIAYHIYSYHLEGTEGRTYLVLGSWSPKHLIFRKEVVEEQMLLDSHSSSTVSVKNVLKK